MKKGMFLLIIFSIIVLSTALAIKGEGVTGEVTGKIVTGEASSQATNVSITIANSYPVLGPINSSIFVCEGQFLDYEFNATDVNRDNLTISISPENPFFIDPEEFKNGDTDINSSIISGKLDKDDVGGVNTGFKVYEENITITDVQYAKDSAITNITVIEINNAPSVTNIRVQTIYTQGENSTFYKQIQANDTEYDGGFGVLNFNISIINSTGDSVNLFNISSSRIMNFTANNTTITGVYNITVCVNDTGLTSPHANISSECGQDGSSRATCINFSLTITDENRAPNITSYSPTNLTQDVNGLTAINFNITKDDPDGTTPDGYWYVDDAFVEYDSESSVDYFEHTFGCEVSGNHTVKAEITDGLLNDSVQWNISVGYVACPPGTAPTGSGGGVRIPAKKFSIDKKSIEVVLKQGESKIETITITNNEKTSLLFTISNTLTDFITMSKESFELGPGEQKKIILDFTAQEYTPANLYIGQIIVNAEGTKKEVLVSVEVETKAPLFDVRIEILKEYLPITPGKDLVANITVFSFEKTEEYDVLLEYIIMDEKGNEIMLDTEIVTVKNKINFIKHFKISKDLPPGRYVLYVRAFYEGEVGSSSVWFWFSAEEKPPVEKKYLLIMVILIIFVIFLITILIRERKKRKQETQTFSMF